MGEQKPFLSILNFYIHIEFIRKFLRYFFDENKGENPVFDQFNILPLGYILRLYILYISNICIRRK